MFGIRRSTPSTWRTLCKKRFSTAAEVEANTSPRVRFAMISAAVTSVSLGTASYLLQTNQDLFMTAVREYPVVVDTLGPWIGLPVDKETGHVDGEALFGVPTAKKVGDNVRVACELLSGKVVVVEIDDVDADISFIDLVLLQTLQTKDLTEDPVVSFYFVDHDDPRSSVAIEKTAIGVPPLPQDIPRIGYCNELLYICREREARIQSFLAQASEPAEIASLKHTLFLFDMRKQEIKQTRRMSRW